LPTALCTLMLVAANGQAEDIVSQVEKGCETEIRNYCSKVTPGEGRMLACFFAHEDKLSNQCQFALYSASAQLEHAVSALNYFAVQCEDDIMTHCADVEIGEGRILDCLASKGDVISAACTQAMDDVLE
jgi:hypothetical protein